jgi:hypothetical protein
MIIQKSFTLLMICFVTALSSLNARAAVMDFTGLTDGDNFSQNGIEMVLVRENRLLRPNEVHMDDGVAYFSLSSLANFSLKSVLMVSVVGDGASGPARFTAFSGGFNLGYVDVSSDAGTYVFPALFSSIDQFQVSVPRSHFTFDNVTIGASSRVPDGGANVVLLGIVMIGMGWIRRTLA